MANYPAIPKTIVNAKGDVIAATGDNAVDRVPVGTDGQVLTADSTQATGLAWAAGGGGGGGGAPSGPAGGVLSGTYPDPGFAADMATQGELDAEAAGRAAADTVLGDAVDAETAARIAADALLAPLASPALTGNPTAPTQAAGNNTTLLASTAFVQQEIAGSTFYLPKSLVDAAGDLIVATANDTPDRLAVGTNGQVLTVDTSLPKKVKWATPSSSGSTGPGAKIRRTTNQSIALSTNTSVIFDTVDWEYGGDYADLAAQPTRLTAVSTGRHMLVGGYRFASNSGGVRDIRFLKNGADLIAFDRKNPVASGGTYQRLTDIADLIAGDYVEMQVWQNAASPMNLEPEGLYSIAFSIVFIGG